MNITVNALEFLDELYARPLFNAYARAQARHYDTAPETWEALPEWEKQAWREVFSRSRAVVSSMENDE